MEAPRFVADCMLGRLAKWLRAFGFDVAYNPFADDCEIARQARERDAILLTRDTHLKHVAGVRVLFVRDDEVESQLHQVVEEIPLNLDAARPLSRCTVCNAELVPAGRHEVLGNVPPFVYLTRDRYARCPSCGRVYWEGTHVTRMRERLAALRQLAGQKQ